MTLSQSSMAWDIIYTSHSGEMMCMMSLSQPCEIHIDTSCSVKSCVLFKSRIMTLSQPNEIHVFLIARRCDVYAGQDASVGLWHCHSVHDLRYTSTLLPLGKWCVWWQVCKWGLWPCHSIMRYTSTHLAMWYDVYDDVIASVGIWLVTAWGDTHPHILPCDMVFMKMWLQV